MMSQWPKFIKARTRALDSISSLTLELRASLHELLLNQLSRTMTERRKKGKKKKGQAVVSLLRMVLLLGCCRGGTSEREENRDKTLHDRNRTQTMKIMKPKKSLFFGTLQNPGAEKSGRVDSTGNQSQVCKENGQDTSGQHEDTDVKSQVYKGNGQDVTGPKDDTGVQTVVTGPSSSPPSQTSTNGHNGASISSVENRTERRRKVTFAADVQLIPEPSNHDDLESRARLLASLERRVLNMALLREQRQDTGQRPDVTPDLCKPRPGPSHTGTTTLPTRTESSGTGKLTEEDDDDDEPTQSIGYRLFFSLFAIIYFYVLLFHLHLLFKSLFY